MQPVSVEVRRGEQAIALVLFALGLYVVFGGLAMPSGTLSTPGPGFFPRAIGTLLAISSALVFIRSLRRREAGSTVLGHRDILLVIAVLMLSALVFAFLGAIAAALVMTALIVKILRECAWWRAILFAVLASGTAWLVFIRLLGLRLPVFPLF